MVFYKVLRNKKITLKSHSDKPDKKAITCVNFVCQSRLSMMSVSTVEVGRGGQVRKGVVVGDGGFVRGRPFNGLCDTLGLSIVLLSISDT